MCGNTRIPPYFHITSKYAPLKTIILFLPYLLFLVYAEVHRFFSVLIISRGVGDTKYKPTN